jgi:hypothetical protein
MEVGTHRGVAQRPAARRREVEFTVCRTAFHADEGYEAFPADEALRLSSPFQASVEKVYNSDIWVELLSTRQGRAHG